MMTTRIKALGTVGAIPLRPLCVTKNEENRVIRENLK